MIKIAGLLLKVYGLPYNDSIESNIAIKDSMSTGGVLLDSVLKYDVSNADVDLWR